MNLDVQLQSFSDFPTSKKLVAIRAIVEAMVVVNWNYLIEHPECPQLKDIAASGHLKLLRDPSATWKDIPAAIMSGASRRDLVCWRIAELRNQGADDVHSYIKAEVKHGAPGEPITMLYILSVRVHDIIEDPTALFPR